MVSLPCLSTIRTYSWSLKDIFPIDVTCWYCLRIASHFFALQLFVSSYVDLVSLIIPACGFIYPPVNIGGIANPLYALANFYPAADKAKGVLDLTNKRRGDFNPAVAGRALILRSLLRYNDVHFIPRQLAARWLIEY